MLCGYKLRLLVALCISSLASCEMLPRRAITPSAADFYVKRVPDLHQDEEHPLHIYSGHIESDPNPSKSADAVTAHLFFVLVKARRMADKERVMFWFNGGPGCSSFDGLMMEVGPWRIDGKHGLKTVEGGWEEYTTMIYIDQPVGTGFSYASTNNYVHGLSEASLQLMTFLKTFYEVFPEYLTMDTYLGGESYAGQFIPYFADSILNSTTLNMPLRGIALGNPWIDGRSQYPAYLDYAVKHGIVEEGSQHYETCSKATQECMNAQYNGKSGPDPVDSFHCEHLLNLVLSIKNRETNGVSECVNIYDVRLYDTSPACGMNWPIDLTNITTYLGRKDVVYALHASAKSTSWTECLGRVHTEFKSGAGAKAISSVTLLPRILSKIPVLIFAGDQDFICNYVGVENTIKALEWNGEKGLGTVQTLSWTVDKTPAGTWVSSRNLTYAKLFNASHMAPYDVPHITHDMILRFMGVNFSAIADGSAKIPSSIGDAAKPILDASEPSASSEPHSTSPEKSKAMWEAYYNAGSAALVLILIAMLVGGLLWCRLRRRNPPQLAGNEEESIPLNSARERDQDDGAYTPRSKGKNRARDLPEQQAIFDVGDSDDEDLEASKRV